MIRSEAEYRKARRNLRQAHSLLDDEIRYWRKEGSDREEVEELVQPLRLRIAELEDEVELYERVRGGDLSMFEAFEEFGKALIAARVARGMTQRELAERLGVHESQVSRDEANEYRGIGTERLEQVLDALGLEFEGHFRLGRGAEEASVRLELGEPRPAVYRRAASVALDEEEISTESTDAGT